MSKFKLEDIKVSEQDKMLYAFARLRDKKKINAFKKMQHDTRATIQSMVESMITHCLKEAGYL